MRSLIFFLEKDICEVIDAPLERGRPDDPGDLTSATHTSGQRITKGRGFFLCLKIFVPSTVKVSPYTHGPLKTRRHTPLAWHNMAQQKYSPSTIICTAGAQEVSTQLSCPS